MIKKLAYILAGLAAAAALVAPSFIRIKVECKDQYGACPEEILVKLRSLNTKYLFQAKKDVAKILKEDFLVSDFSMQLKLPNILAVNLLVKRPVFSVFSKSQNKYLLVDDTGLVLALADKTDLPILIKDNVDTQKGQKVSDTDLFALKLIQGIAQMYQIRSGTIQNDTLVVDIPHGVRVILPLRDADSQVLLGSLRLIYTKITTESIGVYSQIDMRFKNPVLR